MYYVGHYARLICTHTHQNTFWKVGQTECKNTEPLSIRKLTNVGCVLLNMCNYHACNLWYNEGKRKKNVERTVVSVQYFTKNKNKMTSRKEVVKTRYGLKIAATISRGTRSKYTNTDIKGKVGLVTKYSNLYHGRPCTFWWTKLFQKYRGFPHMYRFA